MEGGEESDDHNEYNFISASTVFVANSAAASFFPKYNFNNQSSFFQKF